MNRAHVRFFATLLAVYVVWFVVYDLWLLPEGRLDAAVSGSVAALGARLLQALGFAATSSGRVASLPGQAGVIVEDGCNGLSTLGLFVGAVVAYPGPWKARAWYLPLGLFVVYAVNVARVAALLWMQGSAPGLFDALHGFAGTTLFYVVVFALWVGWMRIGDGARRTAGATQPV